MGAMDVVVMQTVLILMVVTGVSVCQDSLEMGTSVQVSLPLSISITSSVRVFRYQ